LEKVVGFRGVVAGAGAGAAEALADAAPLGPASHLQPVGPLAARTTLVAPQPIAAPSGRWSFWTESIAASTGADSLAAILAELAVSAASAHAALLFDIRQKIDRHREHDRGRIFDADLDQSLQVTELQCGSGRLEDLGGFGEL